MRLQQREVQNSCPAVSHHEQATDGAYRPGRLDHSVLDLLPQYKAPMLALRLISFICSMLCITSKLEEPAHNLQLRTESSDNTRRHLVHCNLWLMHWLLRRFDQIAHAQHRLHLLLVHSSVLIKAL